MFYEPKNGVPLPHNPLNAIVVPRPIGWISTWGVNDEPNLAPFSYFNALASTPMLVGVSIGHRSSGPKDTLVNIRDRRAFCVNIVTEPFLNAMNSTSADVAPASNQSSGLNRSPMSG